MSMPIALFTDFGYEGPYVGQVKAAIHAISPGVAVIDLQHDVPPCRVLPAAHLLAALVPRLPGECVVLAVVDPGVGTSRDGLIVNADGRWLVGPDNGLLAVAGARSHGEVESWKITWSPGEVSATFHGRDFFAPVAASLAVGNMPPSVQVAPGACVGWRDAEDLGEIVYIDNFGNAMTGLRGDGVATSAVLRCRHMELHRARTYGDVPEGEAFWYVNSIGLIEIAANRASAAAELGLEVGARVELLQA